MACIVSNNSNVRKNTFAQVSPSKNTSIQLSAIKNTQHLTAAQKNTAQRLLEKTRPHMRPLQKHIYQNLLTKNTRWLVCVHIETVDFFTGQSWAIVIHWVKLWLPTLLLRMSLIFLSLRGWRWVGAFCLRTRRRLFKMNICTVLKLSDYPALL